jgi:hypothetical protein
MFAFDFCQQNHCLDNLNYKNCKLLGSLSFIVYLCTAKQIQMNIIHT